MKINYRKLLPQITKQESHRLWVVARCSERGGEFIDSTFYFEGYKDAKKHYDMCLINSSTHSVSLCLNLEDSEWAGVEYMNKSQV